MIKASAFFKEYKYKKFDDKSLCYLIIFFEKQKLSTFWCVFLNLKEAAKKYINVDYLFYIVELMELKINMFVYIGNNKKQLDLI